MLPIGGFLPLTLSDYPGHLAAMVFTRGCNFRCPFCHNGHLLEEEAPELDSSRVLARLKRRASKLQGLVVSGGEPTLHAELFPFLRAVRSLGLTVKLDTNGSHPEVLERLLREGLLDFVAMDIKAPWPRYQRLAGVPCDTEALRRSVALIAASGRDHQFRTTRVTPLLTEEDEAAIVAQVPPGSPHRWQEFQPEHSLDPNLRTGCASR